MFCIQIHTIGLGKINRAFARGRIQDAINKKLREKKLLTLNNITQSQLDSVQKNKAVKFSTVRGSKDSDS